MDAEKDKVVQELLHAYGQFRRANWGHGSIAGLRRSEMLVLFCIRDGVHSSGEGLRASDLSSRLNVASPTLTQQMNELEGRGFVERNADPEDRRAVRIKLTDKGQQVVIVAHEEFLARFKGLVDYLGIEDSRKLAELMSKAFTYFQGTREDSP
jgi:DNA-binding MarR family transcriptional regulator